MTVNIQLISLSPSFLLLATYFLSGVGDGGGRGFTEGLKVSDLILECGGDLL